MAKVEVHKTDNYRLFDILECNREIDRNHVEQLKRSIKEKNLLESNPIIVNSNLEIIDGQHRLEACKELGIPIYYRVDRNVQKEDMLRLNKFSKNWTLIDYINYYAKTGNENYIVLQRLLEESPLNKTFTCAVFGSSAGDGFMKIRKGELKNLDAYEAYLKKIHHLNKIGECLDHLRIHGKGIKLNTLVIRALLPIISKEEFDVDLFCNKLGYNSHRLIPSATIKQYQSLFFYVYNYRNSKPLALSS